MASLKSIIARYGGGLTRVAAAYEADKALQEDLVQDTLLAIHRALPSLRNEASLGPFVFRIAHNRGVSHVVRQRAARTAARYALLPDAPLNPEEELLADERSARLAAAIRLLPLPYRQVITLVLEDLSYEAIAETLNLTVSNVGVRLNRAKAQLKEILGG